jgi:hypothetical protein
VLLVVTCHLLLLPAYVTGQTGQVTAAAAVAADAGRRPLSQLLLAPAAASAAAAGGGGAVQAAACLAAAAAVGVWVPLVAMQCLGVTPHQAMPAGWVVLLQALAAHQTAAAAVAASVAAALLAAAAAVVEAVVWGLNWSACCSGPCQHTHIHMTSGLRPLPTYTHTHDVRDEAPADIHTYT